MTHLALGINSLPHTILDYGDTEGVFLTHDGIDYRCCMFDVESPAVNKYRVARVDLGKGEIWIRKALGKAENDPAHLVTTDVEPEDKNGLIEVILNQGDDERDEAGNPVYFPLRVSRRTDISLRFYSQDKEHSVQVCFY